jgi:ribosome biogenesis GTPase
MTAPANLLVELGWTAFFGDQLVPGDADPVRVMAVHRGKIAVAGPVFDGFVRPSVAQAETEEDQPAVGDWALLDPETLQMTRILRRANLFKRLAPGHARKVQLIAANIDTVFIAASCNEDFNLARIERYLVLAREIGVHPVLVLTKADLTATADRYADAARGLQAGLDVAVVNGRDAQSVAPLQRWCTAGQTVAVLGSSGVGKSTLINTLLGSDDIATQAVRSADGKGRHTTTVRQMHRMAGGGWLVDTPGMRELQLTDATAGLAHVFENIHQIGAGCRFSDCSHSVEPGCAVRDALADGTLDAAQFARWQKLTAEEAENTTSLAQRRGRGGPPTSRR